MISAAENALSIGFIEALAALTEYFGVERPSLARSLSEMAPKKLFY